MDFPMHDSREHAPLNELLALFDKSIEDIVADPLAAAGSSVPAERSIRVVAKAVDATQSPSSGTLEFSQSASRGLPPKCHAEKVSHSFLRALQAFCFGLIRPTEDILSHRLQTHAKIQLIRLEAIPYERFLQDHGGPSFSAILTPVPRGLPWLITMQMQILYPVIDRMLGSAMDSEIHAERPLSNIEMRLASRIAEDVIRPWQSALQTINPLDLKIQRIEQHRASIRALSVDEPILAVGYELALGTHVGTIHWCIPISFLETMETPLIELSRLVDTSDSEWIRTRDRLGDSSITDESEVTVTLAHSSIPLSELTKIEVGDIISIEKEVGQWMEVEIGNEIRFLASPGSYRGRKAARIEQIVAPQDASSSS
jgi:flagellar motor switch protein FliM